MRQARVLEEALEAAATELAESSESRERSVREAVGGLEQRDRARAETYSSLAASLQAAVEEAKEGERVARAAQLDAERAASAAAADAKRSAKSAEKIVEGLKRKLHEGEAAAARAEADARDAEGRHAQQCERLSRQLSRAQGQQAQLQAQLESELRRRPMLEAAEAEVASGRLALADATDALAAAKSDAAAEEARRAAEAKAVAVLTEQANWNGEALAAARASATEADRRAAQEIALLACELATS